MVGGEAALEIRVLHRHGKGIREIARETGSSRNTVRRYLRDESAARYKARPRQATKLDPFKAYVVERLTAAAPERIPASVLLRELRERGYTGGYTMLKALVASLKPKEAAVPIIRFETEPGEQMQVDWAVIRRGSNRLSVFVATLGWSRAAYVEFVTDERVETLICRRLTRSCNTLRVSADPVAKPAAPSRAESRGSRPKTAARGERRTLRWREVDSNFRFRVAGLR